MMIIIYVQSSILDYGCFVVPEQENHVKEIGLYSVPDSNRCYMSESHVSLPLDERSMREDARVNILPVTILLSYHQGTTATKPFTTNMHG